MTPRHCSLLLCVIVFFLSISPVYALERFDIVTTEEMKQMLKEREEGKIDFLLVNTLDQIIYENFSIPGSINIPWVRTHELAHSRLGDDKNKLVITY
jgi:3-mercaptopyruvate sulfurtransferase SseA